jgi:spermidine/putrescine ABC transporter ATP-binding subunit
VTDPARDFAAGPATVELVGLGKLYGGQAAVRHLDLRIEAGEFVALLGPSGSGKTSILMMIAGFVKPTAGDIKIGPRSVLATPPEARDVGVVFQSYALFPHLTVFDNVSFPLEMRGRKRAESRTQVEQVLRLVGLEGFGRRYPHELSGGQQQRVALARAIVFRPGLLLMDEPLGALDRQLRKQMQHEIRVLHRELGTTILYVTHDQEEALALADRVGVMYQGELVQVDTPVRLYNQPVNRFVARFVGDCNFLEVDELRREAGAWTVRIGDYGGCLAAGETAAAPPSPSVLAIRPNAVSLRPASEPVGLPGEVKDAVFVGEVVEYVVALGSGSEITVRQPVASAETPAAPGTAVRVSWRWSDARLL